MQLDQGINLIERLCVDYRDAAMCGELCAERSRLAQKIGNLCREVGKSKDIAHPSLLIALLDAYEVTRDEDMLQEVLDVVGTGLERLEVSADSVKLLSYCYYYVEAPECAERALEILRKLRGQGRDGKLEEAEEVYRELVK